jgi:hypothetical protein
VWFCKKPAEKKAYSPSSVGAASDGKPLAALFATTPNLVDGV